MNISGAWCASWVPMTGTSPCGMSAGRSNGAGKQAEDYVRRLIRGGYVEVAGRQVGHNGACMYRLARRPHEAPRLRRDGKPARPSGQRQIWNAIRRMKQFMTVELAVTASTDECRVTPATAQTYVLRLAAAGYLAVKQPGKPGKPAIWRLRPSMDTGPRPPAVLRSRLVYDHNRGAVMGLIEADEEEGS